MTGTTMVFVVTLSKFGRSLEQKIIGVAATQDIGKRLGEEYLEEVGLTAKWERKPETWTVYSMHHQMIVTIFRMLVADR